MLPARFYRSETGAEPVREWLVSMPKKDRRITGVDIATVEYGWPIGMPTCRPLLAPGAALRARVFAMDGGDGEVPIDVATHPQGDGTSHVAGASEIERPATDASDSPQRARARRRRSAVPVRRHCPRSA
jgi:hypothetical protein